jgi:thiamine-phosphate pyrophosphorylase
MLDKVGETALDICAYAAHMAALMGAHIIKVKPPTARSRSTPRRRSTRRTRSTSRRRWPRASPHRAGLLQRPPPRGVLGRRGEGHEAAPGRGRAIHAGGGNGSIVGRNAFQRPKEGAERDAVARAIAALLPVTQRADIALLLDGDAALARELGCDGVHVAAEMTAAARAIAGDALSVGAACGASVDAAIDAAEAGADYVAFGPVVGDDAVELETVSNWASAMVVPCVVGGGLAGDNVAGWAATGAEFIALGRAIWQAEEPPDLALRRLLSSLGRSGRIG